jgi:hypothetical protein
VPGRRDITLEVLLDGDWHRRCPSNDAGTIDQALSVREMTDKPTMLATCDTRQLYPAGAVGTRNERALPLIIDPCPDKQADNTRLQAAV